MRAFLDSKPYAVAIKENPNGGHPIWYLSELKSPPDTLAAIGADVVQNLRSALDTMAYQIVLSERDGAKPDWKVYFPFSKSASDYKGTRGGCIKGVRQEIVDAFDATEPYKGGKGHALWQLQQISNPDKHELPLSVGSYAAGVDVSAELEHGMREALSALPNLAAKFEKFPFPFPQIFLQEVGELSPLQVGYELYIGPAEPEMIEKRQFAFDITIDAPEIIDAEPALKTLKDMTDLVSDIVGELSGFLK